MKSQPTIARPRRGDPSLGGGVVASRSQCAGIASLGAPRRRLKSEVSRWPPYSLPGPKALCFHGARISSHIEIVSPHLDFPRFYFKYANTWKIDVAGLSTKIVVKGTLDLSGAKPRIEIESVRAGSLPSAVAKPAVDLILDTGNVRTLDLDVNLTAIEFSDGQATLSGAP